jgi:hypothetical protein
MGLQPREVRAIQTPVHDLPADLGRASPTDTALALLCVYRQCAVLLGFPSWEVAADWGLLMQLGVTVGLLQSLIARGQFEPLAEGNNGLSLEDRIQRVLGPVETDEMARPAGVPGEACLSENEAHGKRVVPYWDGKEGELWYDGVVIKRLAVQAVNQVCILAAFQECAWPDRLDDPLPGGRRVNAKQRLSDVARDLTRSQRPRRLCFKVERGREGIRWFPI